MKLTDEQFQNMTAMMNPDMIKNAASMMKQNPDLMRQAKEMQAQRSAQPTVNQSIPSAQIPTP